jgi:DNA mismatch repair ATPase MutS
MITIKKEAVRDLIKVKDKFSAIVESIELMSNKEFMGSYKKAREQIKKREFADWDAL